MSTPAPITRPILAPNGQPARLPADAKCPHCGAGPEKREKTGFGPTQDVTCTVCCHEFDKEPV